MDAASLAPAGAAGTLVTMPNVLHRMRREIESAGRGSLRRMAMRVDGHRSAYQRRRWDTRAVYGAIGLLNERYDYATESLAA